MRVLIAGSNGQLGQALRHCAPPSSEVIAPAEADFDITDASVVMKVVSEARPDVLFNAAGYTAVDTAESEPALAQMINATSVAHLAQAARNYNAHLVHVSTDFVFDGQGCRAYRPEDQPAPQSVYGRTKWEGEQVVGSDMLIVRTAWLYAPDGSNFVRTMLRVMAERSEVRVVTDQIGTPTYARSLAAALWVLAERRATGIFHFTDSGVASWYDFAVAIQEEALSLGLLARAIPITPIQTEDYPTPAKRPAFSVLDKSHTWLALGNPAPHWRTNLRHMLQEVKDRG